MVPFVSLSAVSYSPSIARVSFRDKARYWSIFSYPCIRRRPRRNIAIPFDMETRMVWLPDGEKSLTICLTVTTQYRRVTDGGRTNGQTDILRRHSPRCACRPHEPKYSFSKQCSYSWGCRSARWTFLSASVYVSKRGAY